MLEKIPDTTKAITFGLTSFANCMDKCYTNINEETAKMIPTFVELRNSTLVDALTYYEFVVPCCKKATTDAA